MHSALRLGAGSRLRLPSHSSSAVVSEALRISSPRCCSEVPGADRPQEQQGRSARSEHDQRHRSHPHRFLTCVVSSLPTGLPPHLDRADLLLSLVQSSLSADSCLSSAQSEKTKHQLEARREEEARRRPTHRRRRRTTSRSIGAADRPPALTVAHLTVPRLPAHPLRARAVFAVASSKNLSPARTCDVRGEE